MFDGSSIDGFARIEEPDMYLVPDYDTFCILPWRNKDGIAEARIICDVHKSDGTLFDGCPRVTLKKSLAKAKETLGEHIFEKYIINKETEWDNYRIAVTDWEIKEYLDLY